MDEKDYILRLIKSCTQLTVSILSGKNVMDSLAPKEKNNITISEGELLSIMISKYVKEKKINEAEDMIFREIEECKSADNLERALAFYRELSSWKDKELEECNFSKREILEGIEDVKKLYE
ncbi:hypothetical protein KYB31_18395 [Clostridium felsineum]|uniref:DUF6483 family protein n=1 Tax=Clostridium felsineum TaxID=36839 RepID=UPI00214DDB1A|nr:DUF6483 family protein [Clostridium felsineum]MCR3760947.1 hypothetical protein [Clostridium felsineum]